ncbi:ATP-binding protein [Actinomadura kijaniata]|uniref:ATP-binding protein n=1 Tax=Actinomadura kijaniata TaxID=46161 RepID=UPI00082FB991|nr:ATP-binding protein [Actinomadura kijaniata]
MAQKLLDITPTPEVLVALTRTPISPLDALSELIDNAIDSFRAAEIAGTPSVVRHVIIDVPGPAAVDRGEGVIRVRDTGLGLTAEQIANAMRAGFTSKNHYDTLGLFGMGFNIATGKLGRITRVISVRTGEDHALQVTLDLPKLIKDQKFEVTAETVERPPGLEHGTIVEVKGWWPQGDANHGFIRDVARMSKDSLRERIGRRYATLLRSDSGRSVKMTVNGEPCRGFEHCAWSEERYVERAGHGKIPARIAIDEELTRSRRCLKDGADFNGGNVCPRCGGTESREVAEHIRGWVGIQRFDDASDFGIDLIRNGRAIRTYEKDAFFTYRDEVKGTSEREYPIDQQYGRIVGEIHLDHVPVDFQKQNFQVSTEEWQTAMRYLRGGSLLPSQWPDDEKNTTPVSLLFQGYRKVRNFGRADLYMGVYDETKGKAVRISREVERDYYQRFLNKEPGYHDDAKWWELVETANEPPIEELPECVSCGFQNVKGAESCGGCAAILIGKQCLNADCGQTIAKQAELCPACGADQNPVIKFPWTCTFCATDNASGITRCVSCGQAEGEPHPASPQALQAESDANSELSVTGLSIELCNGKSTNPLDVRVRNVHRPILTRPERPAVPLITERTTGHITVYIHLGHAIFANGVRPAYVIASEVAQYLYSLHQNLAGQPGHSIGTITTQVLMQGWGDAVTENADSVRQAIRTLMAGVVDRAAGISQAKDFYAELTGEQQSAMANEMISADVDLAELDHLKSGGYLKYCTPETLAAFFGRFPAAWFGGTVWSDPWPSAEQLLPVAASALQSELTTKYQRCLEDCASYLRYQQPERLIVVRARAAAEFLGDKLA